MACHVTFYEVFCTSLFSVMHFYSGLRCSVLHSTVHKVYRGKAPTLGGEQETATTRKTVAFSLLCSIQYTHSLSFLFVRSHSTTQWHGSVKCASETIRQNPHLLSCLVRAVSSCEGDTTKTASYFRELLHINYFYNTVAAFPLRLSAQ